MAGTASELETYPCSSQKQPKSNYALLGGRAASSNHRSPSGHWLQSLPHSLPSQGQHPGPTQGGSQGPQHLLRSAPGALTPRIAIPPGHTPCQAPIQPPQPLANPTLTASTCRACTQQIPADPANHSPMAESLQREGKLSPACSSLLQIRQAEKQLG